MDIDTIEPGEDFVTVIENAVASCEVLIAIIGRSWLSDTAGATGRLNDPKDFVRVEIATALRRDIRIIPVLVQRASMPKQQDLPDILAKLSRRNAIELSDVRWHTDVAELIEVMERVLAKREEAARLEEAARQAVAERQRQAEEEERRAEEERRLRLAEEAKQRAAQEQRRKKGERLRAEEEQRLRLVEEAKQRAAEERLRIEKEIERREAEERARQETQEAARQAEEERQRPAEAEKRRLEEERRLRFEKEAAELAAAEKRLAVERENQLRVAEGAAAQLATKERLRENEEIARREAEEQATLEAHEASQRRAKEESAQAEVEARRRTQREAEFRRVEPEQEVELGRLETEKQERNRWEAEEAKREHATQQVRQASLEEMQTRPGPPAIATTPSSKPATQLSESRAIFGDSTPPLEDGLKRTMFFVTIACVAVLATVAFIWMISRRPASEEQSANRSASTPQTGQTINALPTTAPTETPSPTPEPIPTPDKVAFEKSLTTLIQKDKDMAQVVEGLGEVYKTVEVAGNRKYRYGDLDGDGAEDAALWFCGENIGLGKMGYWCKLVAFRNINGVLTKFAAFKRLNSIGVYQELLSITDKKIVLATERLTDVTDITSPIKKGRAKFVLDGNKLKEVR